MRNDRKSICSRITNLQEQRERAQGRRIVVRAVTPEGEEKTMTVDELIETGSDWRGCVSGDSLDDLRKLLDHVCGPNCAIT